MDVYGAGIIGRPRVVYGNPDAVGSAARQDARLRARIAGVEEGRKAGFAEAVRRYRITYPCKRCGKLMVATVGSEDAEDARQALIDAGWAHGDCLEAGAQ